MPLPKDTFHNEAKLRRANERKVNHENRRQALELFKAGSSFADIGRHLGVSRQVATRYVKEELAKITAARTEIAEQAFDGELIRLDNVIRQAWTMVVASCKGCAGTGDGPEPIEGVSGLANVCMHCHGDGRLHRPEVRLRALREYRTGVHQRSQMLGLYAPEKFAMTDADGNTLDFREEIRNLEGEDLARELEAYLEGVTAARSQSS